MHFQALNRPQVLHTLQCQLALDTQIQVCNNSETGPSLAFLTQWFAAAKTNSSSNPNVLQMNTIRNRSCTYDCFGVQILNLQGVTELPSWHSVDSHRKAMSVWFRLCGHLDYQRTQAIEASRLGRTCLTETCISQSSLNLPSGKWKFSSTEIILYTLVQIVLNKEQGRFIIKLRCFLTLVIAGFAHLSENSSHTLYLMMN